MADRNQNSFTHYVTFGWNEIPCPEIVAAAAEGQAALVEKLGAQGDYLNALDRDGNSALSWAIFNNHEATIDVLLRLGAELDTVSGYLGSPFLIALNDGPPERVQKLMPYSKRFIPSSPDVEAIFINVIRNQNFDMFTFLLQNGVSANAKNARGVTALQQAIDSCYEEFAIALIHHGANINEPNEKGESPLHLATFKYPAMNKRVRRMLKANGAKFMPPLSWKDRFIIWFG